MTNPDNIVRVRARNGGRASVYEANGWAQSYSAGLFEGDGVIQNTVADMNVLVGGSSSKPDVVLAENPAGYKIALDLVGQQPIAITAPASNNRISSIVAYTDDLSLATTEDTVTGSPASCGLIVVNGTAAVNPTEPSDADIRSAITADGATGSQAVYVVIANILVSSNTTAITNSLIVTNRATLNVTNNIAPASITANKLDFTTMPKVIACGTKTLGVISPTSNAQVSVTIPTQPNADYKVLLTLRGGGNAYSFVTLTSLSFSNSGFTIEGWNNHTTSSTSNIRVDYLVVY